MQMLKQLVPRKLGPTSAAETFWQRRYCDFNVFSQRKLAEKLRYMHGNPVTRGLVTRPEDWLWSSFNHYATGHEGTVEIESDWTVRERERLGTTPQVKRRGAE
jgi:putative transposase